MMKYAFDEIDELRDLLEAEIDGVPIDRGKGNRLAMRLAELYPVIGSSMSRIALRMASDPTDSRS